MIAQLSWPKRSVTGVAALIIFGRVRSGEAALRSRFVERSSWLEKIRSGIYLSGTLARDYFAEPDGSDAPALLQKLGLCEEDVKHALDRYSGSGHQKLKIATRPSWAER